MSNDIFPTVGDANKYCEKFGLKRVHFLVVFETAEALHRAFVAGQEAAQQSAEGDDDGVILVIEANLTDKTARIIRR